MSFYRCLFHDRLMEFQTSAGGAVETTEVDGCAQTMTRNRSSIVLGGRRCVVLSAVASLHGSFRASSWLVAADPRTI